MNRVSDVSDHTYISVDVSSFMMTSSKQVSLDQMITTRRRFDIILGLLRIRFEKGY